jgi:hypothetical protein
VQWLTPEKTYLGLGNKKTNSQAEPSNSSVPYKPKSSPTEKRIRCCGRTRRPLPAPGVGDYDRRDTSFEREEVASRLNEEPARGFNQAIKCVDQSDPDQRAWYWAYPVKSCYIIGRCSSREFHAAQSDNRNA